MKFEFSRQIFEKTETPNFVKILSVEAELFNADGQTDITQLIIAFRNFSNVSKNKQVVYENIRFK